MNINKIISTTHKQYTPKAVLIDKSVSNDIRKALKPCINNFRYLSRKYNLQINVVTAHDSYVTNDPHMAYIVVKDKVTDIYSNMHTPDLLRRIYELVSKVIK